MIVLENEGFRVEINPFGAELTSFRSKTTGTEYVWGGDPAAWKRHAPVLFPIVGRLKDKTYTVDGASFEITQHGFGRDLEWEPKQVSGTCAEFTLTQSEYTKKMYPWDFTCTLRFTLDGGSLIKEHITRNDSGSTMYYEIGGHDAYTLCWQEGEKITDYFVEFEETDALTRIVTDEDVMLTEKRTSVPLDGGKLHISRELFANDAVMTEGLTVRRASIGSTKNSRRVTMEFGDFPYFAVWSPYKDFDVPFTCLEPWSTLPDGTHLDHAIENKQGIRRLAPGESETLAFRTTITE